MGIRRNGRRKRRRGVPSMAIRSDDITQAEARAFWLQLDIPLDENPNAGIFSTSASVSARVRLSPSHRASLGAVSAYRLTESHGSCGMGEVPSGMKVRRTCRNLTCCNPSSHGVRQRRQASVFKRTRATASDAPLAYIKSLV